MSSLAIGLDYPVRELAGLGWTAHQPLRVLYVEDNAEQAQMIKWMLESSDMAFDVSWQDTIMKAMEFLSTEPADVVLLDLGMPELTGASSLTAIRVSAPKVPVVILTADSSARARLLAGGVGASAFLVKSETTPQEICRRLAEAAGVTGPDDPDAGEGAPTAN